MRTSTATGVTLAVLAYTAWGFLSPVGQILLDHMGPFAANAIRTLGSLPFLALLMGPRKVRNALRLVATNLQVWLLGSVFLAVCLVPYLASLRYLPPTITTLTVYLTPLLVAGWMRLTGRERVGRLVIPTVAATLLGGFLAIAGPAGAPPGAPGALGLGLAILGVLGWTAYTLHLSRLAREHDPDQVTFAAFVTSAASFVGGAFAIEGFHVSWSTPLAGWILLYVGVPSVLSFFLYSRSIRIIGATTVSVLLGIELVSTAFVSAWITGETFTPLKVAGLGIVVLFITLYLWDEARLSGARTAGSKPGT